jgi:hypothetical protein
MLTDYSLGMFELNRVDRIRFVIVQITQLIEGKWNVPEPHGSCENLTSSTFSSKPRGAHWIMPGLSGTALINPDHRAIDGKKRKPLDQQATFSKGPWRRKAQQWVGTAPRLKRPPAGRAFRFPLQA